MTISGEPSPAEASPSRPSPAESLSPESPESHHRCSAKDCRAAATWALLWNNPSLHTAERRKQWVACDDHREHLGDFLARRGFLRDVEPMTAVRPAV